MRLPELRNFAVVPSIDRSKARRWACTENYMDHAPSNPVDLAPPCADRPGMNVALDLGMSKPHAWSAGLEVA